MSHDELLSLKPVGYTMTLLLCMTKERLGFNVIYVVLLAHSWSSDHTLMSSCLHLKNIQLKQWLVRFQ